MTLATLILAFVALLIAIFTLSRGVPPGASPLGVAVLLLAVGEILLSWGAHGILTR